jgi:hypothetical protein
MDVSYTHWCQKDTNKPVVLTGKKIYPIFAEWCHTGRQVTATSMWNL